MRIAVGPGEAHPQFLEDLQASDVLGHGSGADLLEAQLKKKNKDTALIRIEQLHPFPEKQVKALIKKYKNGKVIWVQEEPLNMGYWSFIQRVMPKQDIQLISRKASASPSTGYSKVHKAEQEKIINQAFEI